MSNTKHKNFLSIADFSAAEIKALIAKAIQLKKQPIDTSSPLLNKSMAMIFDKSSLRTRLSFEVGMTQLGGHAVYLAPDDIKLGVRESVHDSAIVISSMADIIIARVSSHEAVEELASNSSVPVINAMTDHEHPIQILADLQTVYEHFGRFDGLTVAYVGDGNNNVTNSWALASHILGIEMRVASPQGYELSDAIRRQAPSVVQLTDPSQAVAGAHIVVADTWVSMGKEAEAQDRLQALAPYQVNAELMKQADSSAIFMHCLPAYRGKEVTADVVDGPQSVVFAEAENRLHAQKALVLSLLGY
jgi:ornithine carbamoyltransferase